MCVNCLQGKQTRERFPKMVLFKSLISVCTNLCDPMSTLSLLGSKYFLSFINDFSRRISIFFFKIKFETLNVFKIYKKEVENQNNKKIKVFKSDQGGEFTSRAFVRFCEE